MNQEPFRIPPAGAPNDYVTYGFTMPKSTHQRKVGCEEYGCEAYANGWVTRVPADSPQARYIDTKAERRHRMEEADGQRTYSFFPGQQCFREHFVPLEKEPIFYRKAGDWRTGGKLHAVEQGRWLEDFQQSTEQIRKNIENGS